MGLCLGGPVLAAVAVGGAALAVKESKGKAGEAVRASGDAMANFGDKIKRIDRENGSKGEAALRAGRDAATDVGERLKKIDREHQITRRASAGLARGSRWVSE